MSGEVALNNQVYAPLLDALARGPKTFDELQGAPELKRNDSSQIRQTVFGMAALGNVLPALPAGGGEARQEIPSRFNETILADRIARGNIEALASPELGNGHVLSFFNPLLLHRHKAFAGNAVAYVQHTLVSAGAKLVQHGKTIANNAENRAVIQRQADRFSDVVMPLLIQLRIAD